MSYLNSIANNVIKNSLQYIDNANSYFTQHPKDVCMNYISHSRFSLHMAKLHAYGVYVSIVHAFFPSMYKSSVTELNNEIATILKNAGCR